LKKYLNQRAFTLIEILIVLAIISILVLLIIPNVENILNSANETGCSALTASDNALSISNELTGDNYSVSPDDLERVCNR